MGIIPIITPTGWLAPIGVFWRELKATMQTVTRKTSDIPMATVRTAIIMSNVNPVPRKAPTTVFKITANDSK